MNNRYKISFKGRGHSYTTKEIDLVSEIMRDFGPSMSPQNAFYILQGLETLPIRMEKHINNTKNILEFLKENKDVAWVSHPNLKDHPDYELASRILQKGAGSIIVFGIKGGREAGSKFINSVKLASHLARIDIIYPWLIEHQLTPLLNNSMALCNAPPATRIGSLHLATHPIDHGPCKNFQEILTFFRHLPSNNRCESSI